MNLRNQFTVRAAAAYLIALAAAWVLTEAVWGATGGLVGGLTMARDPEYLQKVDSFLKERGVDPQGSRAQARSAYQNLSKEDKEELMKLTKEAVAHINWFCVTLFVSAVVFGLVGFLGGLFSRAWLLAGAVPALSFLTNNPVIRFQMAKELSVLQKATVVVLAQFAVCYLLAYCGARLGLKRQRQKRIKDSQSAQANADSAAGDGAGSADPHGGRQC